MTRPKKTTRTLVSVLLWAIVITLCSQGCLCDRFNPRDRVARDVSSHFSGAPSNNTAEIAQLTGMSVAEVQAIEKTRYDNWFENHWVDSDLVIIPAGQDSVEIDGWYNMTERVNKRSFTGRYRMTVTSGTNSADPAAGAGFGGTSWTDVSNVYLVERLERPQAPKGVTAILPGQLVEGVFEERGPQVHRYLVSLPPKRRGSFDTAIGIEAVHTRILRSGAELSLLDEHDRVKPSYKFGSYFDTGEGGEFLLEVSPLPGLLAWPAHYAFRIYWGSGTCNLPPLGK